MEWVSNGCLIINNYITVNLYVIQGAYCTVIYRGCGTGNDGVGGNRQVHWSYKKKSKINLKNAYFLNTYNKHHILLNITYKQIK